MNYPWYNRNPDKKTEMWPERNFKVFLKVWNACLDNCYLTLWRKCLGEQSAVTPRKKTKYWCSWPAGASWQCPLLHSWPSVQSPSWITGGGRVNLNLIHGVGSLLSFIWTVLLSPLLLCFLHGEWGTKALILLKPYLAVIQILFWSK